MSIVPYSTRHIHVHTVHVPGGWCPSRVSFLLSTQMRGRTPFYHLAVGGHLVDACSAVELAQLSCSGNS